MASRNRPPNRSSVLTRVDPSLLRPDPVIDRADRADRVDRAPVDQTPRGELPPRASLYDSRRGRLYLKPRWRGWMHLVFFEASLVAGTALVLAAHGATAQAATAFYAAGVSGLFGVSALYHRGNWGTTASSRLQRLDHLMIFVLIAGTATPLFLLTTPGDYGVICLIVVWSLTAVTGATHLVWMDAPEWLVGSTFIGLGSCAALALPGVWQHAGVAAAILILVGGVLYAVGAVSYHIRRPDPFPTVFGYHEVFHAYVCAAAACHYVAIAMIVW